MKADRSHQVDQSAMLKDGLPGLRGSVRLQLPHPVLADPVHDPHGAVNAGLLTLSRCRIDEAVRRSYPVDEQASS